MTRDARKPSGRSLLGPAAAALALASGCGGGGEDEERTQRADPPRPPAPRPAIPSEGTGPPPPGAERVIRSWSAAIREADFPRAASLFAVGARVQNGGAPRTLDSPTLVLAWNATLPCGAVLTNLEGAQGGFAIADFRLTDRKGSSCGSGTGAPAKTAILVRDGRIVAWYRLPDEPTRPPESERELS
jgi:hypothetical protein